MTPGLAALAGTVVAASAGEAMGAVVALAVASDGVDAGSVVGALGNAPSACGDVPEPHPASTAHSTKTSPLDRSPMRSLLRSSSLDGTLGAVN